MLQILLFFFVENPYSASGQAESWLSTIVSYLQTFWWLLPCAYLPLIAVLVYRRQWMKALIITVGGIGSTVAVWGIFNGPYDYHCFVNCAPEIFN